MRKYFIILLFGLLMPACTSPVSPAPADLISPRQMTGILIDLHVGEARLDNLGVMPDTGAVVFTKVQQEIFKKHQITEDRFYKSYNYYLANVGELDKIYLKVIDSLSLNEMEASRRRP